MGTGSVFRHERGLQRLKQAGLMLLFTLAVGCASVPPQPPVSVDDLAWAVSGAGMLPASGPAVSEDLPSLLHVTDAMRRFARDATRDEFSVARKSSVLAKALAAQDGLNLQYDASATLTAQQAFEQRRANCLSYTLLYVALAREVGVPARFNEVDIPPVWDLGDDRTSLLYRHLNARIDLGASRYQIVDVSGDDYSPIYDQRIISDQAATAQFYNNRAVELELQQRYADALPYQLRALELSPHAAYLWTNLANLYLHDGNLRAARIAVSQALSLDPSDMLGQDLAAHVYEQLGERRLARYFHERAQAFLDQNPYYHYQLGLAALRDGDNQQAYEETHRAILLYSKDSRFFFLMAVVLERIGQFKLAKDSMSVAIELTPDAAQQQRYRSKFAKLTSPG